MTSDHDAPICWACEGTGTDWGSTCNICHGEGHAEPMVVRTVLGVSIDHTPGTGTGSGSSRSAAPRIQGVSFAKLPDGTWGLRGADLVEGAEVIVEKRNGSRETHIVGQIVVQSNKYGDTLARIGIEPQVEGAPVANPASDKQVSFLRSLGASDEQVANISKSAASALIEELKANPPAAKATAAPAVELEHGRVYADAEGAPIKVALSKSSGNFYAKTWDGHGWEYSPGAIKRIVRKLTAEDASQWGHEHDRCVFCSRLLADEGENRSVAVGYGPVCARKNELPWG